jgi:hypothetical protein
MATANPSPAKPSHGRRWPWTAGAALAILIAWFWSPLNGFAITGAAYGARVACSCHYLGGRSLDDCRKDFEPGMELVILSADKDAKSVTARFPMLATQTAKYTEGHGCRLEPWENEW